MNVPEDMVMMKDPNSKLKAIVNQKTWVFPAIILLIIVVSSSLRIHNIQNYPLWEDEARSIITTSNIGRYGVPSFENGEIYTRGIIYHYLLFLPLTLFGISNLFALRILGVIFGALIILLVYRMASQLDGKLVGVVSAAFIAFSSYQNYYVLSVRFYIAFQFFFTLTLYLIYLGWIKDNIKYKKYAVLSFSATLLVHELGVLVAVIFFAYLLFLQRANFYKDPYLYIMGLAGAACLYFTLIYNPTADLSAGGQANYDTLPLVIGNNLRYGDKLFFLKFLNKLVFNFGWIILLGILLPPSTQKKQFYYYNFAFICTIAIISLISPGPSDRYIFNIYPVFIILFCYAYIKIMKLVFYNSIQYLVSENNKENKLKNKVVMIGVCLILLVSTAIAAKGNIWKNFNYKSRSHNLGYAHQVVSRKIAENDILVSTNPGVTWVYLKKPEYFLRQVSWNEKGVFSGEFRPFDYEVNKKQDMIMVDTLAELESLRDRKERVWIITDIKLRLFTSPSMIKFIENNFIIIYQDNNCVVYSNRV